MKVGIMQPYFVPYIGYWQLLNAVDKYVIYDDVNYINRGWVNRNRILLNGEPKYFNLSMLAASQNKLINQICVNKDCRLLEKNLKTIELAYKKAPFYYDVFPLIEQMLRCDKDILSCYISDTIKIVCEYLDIKTELIVSSELKKDCSLKGQDKILAICELLNATEYYNAIGGMKLYSFDAFKEKNIRLAFLKTNKIEYKQFGNEFQSNLSIVDVLMFNSKDEVKKMLNEYTLLDETNVAK